MQMNNRQWENTDLNMQREVINKMVETIRVEPIINTREGSEVNKDT